MTVSDHSLSPALQHVMDARGANMLQARLIRNADTAAVDSLVEEIALLDVPAATRARLLGYCDQLLSVNDVEGEHERQAAGVLDSAVTVLRSGRRHGRRQPFTVKDNARRLRPALRVLDERDGHDELQRASARRAVDQVLASVPAAALLTSSMRNELGPNRYRLLEQLAAARTAVVA